MVGGVFKLYARASGELHAPAMVQKAFPHERENVLFNGMRVFRSVQYKF